MEPEIERTLKATSKFCDGTGIDRIVDWFGVGRWYWVDVFCVGVEEIWVKSVWGEILTHLPKIWNDTIYGQDFLLWVGVRSWNLKAKQTST